MQRSARRSVAIVFLAGLLISAQGQDGGDPAIPPRGGKGRIQIFTHPEKATAYLAGVKLGLTPIDTPFESGRHSLTVVLEGEELIRQRINIWPDSTTVINKSLKMPYGTLVIKPNPPGVRYQVFVDSQIVGELNNTGETTVNKVNAGSRVIGITNGKRSQEFQVFVRPEQTVELNVELREK